MRCLTWLTGRFFTSSQWGSFLDTQLLYIDSVKPILQNFLLDSSLPIEDLLMTREPAVSEKCFSVINFGTFCNVFPAGVWARHTCVQRIGVALSGRGQACVELVAQKITGELEILSQQIVTLNSSLQASGLEVDLDPNLVNLFVRVMEQSEDVLISGGCFFSSDVLPRSDSSLAIVICTFRREEFVKKNVDQILRFIDRWPDVCPVECIVVDNDGGLKFRSHESLTLLKNKCNTGGSGGFARGIIEAYERNSSSHILIMDDDIVFHSELIFRLLALLKYASDESFAVGGVMLRLQQPELIHEWGARFPGHSVPLRSGVDVMDMNSFLPEDSIVDYNAWTCFCYPVKSRPLPLPFFVRGDDSEFGLRTRFDTVIVPSIAVWHHAFTTDSAFMRYLSFRNEMVINCLYPQQSRFPFLRIFLSVFYFCMLYRYSTAQIVLDAVNDFLKGPSELEKNDYSSLMRRYRSWPEHGADALPDTFDDENYQMTMNRPTGGLAFTLSALTFNGHFFPADKSVRHASSANWAYALERNFRSSSIYYWNEDRKTGYVARRSLKKAFRISLSTIVTVGYFCIKYARVKKEYRHKKDYLTSIQFWKNYLQL